MLKCYWTVVVFAGTCVTVSAHALPHLDIDLKILGYCLYINIIKTSVTYMPKCK